MDVDDADVRVERGKRRELLAGERAVMVFAAERLNVSVPSMCLAGMNERPGGSRGEPPGEGALDQSVLRIALLWNALARAGRQPADLVADDVGDVAAVHAPG